MGVEALAQCYNIDHRCAPLWSVGILHNATLHDNGPPYLIFGEGIAGYVGFFQSLGSDSSKLASAFAAVLWSLA